MSVFNTVSILVIYVTIGYLIAVKLQPEHREILLTEKTLRPLAEQPIGYHFGAFVFFSRAHINVLVDVYQLTNQRTKMPPASIYPRVLVIADTRRTFETPEEESAWLSGLMLFLVAWGNDACDSVRAHLDDPCTLVFYDTLRARCQISMLVSHECRKQRTAASIALFESNWDDILANGMPDSDWSADKPCPGFNS